ncbi:MAG TPA: amidohydrolase family protein [Burkholderiales bacterium]|jgi:predicted TIM-barrel fold metal-dependent hydrolase|nr:amidohydrolase family protein [Burkholderiales bacterium]
MATAASNAGAPACAPPDFNPRRPKRLRLPAFACDCHAHVLGPAARYDYSPARVYTPPDCLLPDYRHMLKTLGVERAVLVQPSVYGTDNTAMLDAMKTDPAHLRGVAVVAEDIAESELKRMHDAGVRGVRVNIVDVKDRKPGTLPLDVLKKLGQRVKPFGWHMEFLMHVDEFPDLDHTFADFPVDIVLGHLGYMRTDKGIAAPGFQALLRLVKSGRCWVKLTGPMRISTTALPYSDVTPFAHALTAANPERIVWGTDWPHVIIKGAMPNDGDLADLLSDWVPDAGLREQVLVKNPARLYGFEK